MKNLLLCSIIGIVLCLTVSCSPDNSADIVTKVTSANEEEFAMKEEGQSPDNAANEFDSAGLLYSEITQAFLNLDTVSNSMAATIETVQELAMKYPEFTVLRPIDYSSPTASQIESILDDEQASMATIIANSPLSLKAKNSLQVFIDSVMVYKQHEIPFDDLYDYIVDFESSVVQDTGYTSTDRRILLTTTSITRHGFHFRRKRKSPRDRDWDISWGSITAGTQGSGASTAEAIVMSVATGIGLNNQ